MANVGRTVAYTFRGVQESLYRSIAGVGAGKFAPHALHTGRQYVRRYARHQAYKREPSVMPKGHQRVAAVDLPTEDRLQFLRRKWRARLRP